MHNPTDSIKGDAQAFREAITISKTTNEELSQPPEIKKPEIDKQSSTHQSSTKTHQSSTNFLENLKHALGIDERELDHIKADAKQFEPVFKNLLKIVMNPSGLERDEQRTPLLTKAQSLNKFTEDNLDFRLQKLESLAALADMISNPSKFIGENNTPLSDKDRLKIKENLIRFKENYPNSEYIPLADKITENLDSKTIYDGDKKGNYQHQTLNQVLESSNLQESILQSLKKHANGIINLDELNDKPLTTITQKIGDFTELPPGISAITENLDGNIKNLKENEQLQNVVGILSRDMPTKNKILENLTVITDRSKGRS